MIHFNFIIYSLFFIICKRNNIIKVQICLMDNFAYNIPKLVPVAVIFLANLLLLKHTVFYNESIIVICGILGY